jgi:hypothetical protein
MSEKVALWGDWAGTAPVSLKGVQSGGPASKGEDLLRAKLDTLLLKLPLLPLDGPLENDPQGCAQPPAVPAAAMSWVALIASACCWAWQAAAALPGTVGAVTPGMAAAAAMSASVLLLVARL